MVMDHPYYALTDSDGRFQLSDILPGTYVVKIWHPYVREDCADGHGRTERPGNT
ncbi:MAG: carboxypeptidase-like regulatory domain-containing protein [Nitrospira sp.]|nr:carboxypeptidase-like regulatory domain-containing protein [Nitrospira sp.]